MQCVFIRHGDLYSSVNASPLPPLESIQSADNLSEDSFPNQTFKLTWSSNTFLWLPFIPTTMRLNNPLFQRLAFSIQSLPLECTYSRYHLARELQHRWYRLEANLYDVIRKLLKAGNALFPLDFAEFPLPNTFGYLRDHKEKRHAINCAKNSRAAFMPLIAMVSFAMALLGRDDLSSSEPHWKEVLKREHVHHVWVDNLHASMAGDFSENTRFGVVMNMHTCQWKYMIGALICAKVPLWLYWGKAEGPFPPLTNHAGYKYPFATYFPTMTEIASARASPHPEPQGDMLPSEPSYGPSFSNVQLHDPEPRRLPPVEPNTRQREGQTWQEFFAAEAERHSRKAARQSSDECQARLQREAAHQDYHEPGRRGATVYRWEDVDGFRIRVRMNRGEVSTWWGGYSHSQKRYNSFENEWDICTEFDPDGRPEDEDFGEDFDEPMEGMSVDRMSPDRSQSPIGPPSYPPSSPAPPSYLEDLMVVYHHEVYPNTLSLTSSGDIHSWMYRRYGFTFDLSALTYIRLDYDGMPDVLPGWHETCRRAGYWDPQDDVSIRAREAISDFITAFLSVGFTPGCIWDLGVSSKHYLRDRSNHVIRVAQRKLKDDKDDKCFYFLEPINSASSPNPPFHLVVPHAASAVQCLREQWGPDLEDIIRHFLSLGIPFSTCIPGPPPHLSITPRPHFGLGCRPVGYQPDLNDHAAYENARLALLSSDRCARAALMKGGIVWRLTQDTLDPDDVFAGPTDECMDPHRGRASTFSDGEVLWDDDLSEEKMDVICGVYRVSTGAILNTNL
jgi:hypothetical protein